MLSINLVESISLIIWMAIKQEKYMTMHWLKKQLFTYNSLLQCYSVLSDILVKNELCIPLERGSNVLTTGESFICLSPPS